MLPTRSARRPGSFAMRPTTRLWTLSGPWVMGETLTTDIHFIWFCLFQTVWDEHDNRTRLAERIDTVNRWKEMLDKCLTDLDAEIDSLTQVGSPGWASAGSYGKAYPPTSFPGLEATITWAEVKIGVTSQGLAPPIPVSFLSRRKSQWSKACRPRTCPRMWPLSV